MSNVNRAVCVAALVAAIAVGVEVRPADAARSRDALYPHRIRLTIERWGKAGWDEMDAALRRIDALRLRIDVGVRRTAVDARRRAR